LTTNLNLHYNKGDLAWVLVASLVCWLITPVYRPSARSLMTGYWVAICRDESTESGFGNASSESVLRRRNRSSILDIRVLNDHVPLFFNYHRKPRSGFSSQHPRIRISGERRYSRYPPGGISLHICHSYCHDSRWCNPRAGTLVPEHVVHILLDNLCLLFPRILGMESKWMAPHAWGLRLCISPSLLKMLTIFRRVQDPFISRRVSPPWLGPSCSENEKIRTARVPIQNMQCHISDLIIRSCLLSGHA